MLTEERMREISALQQRVALQGEDLYHKGTPWPEVVSRQHAAIYELVNEVRRLQEFEPKTVRIHTSLVCINCGEEIKSYGPETFHVESTMIRCDLPGNDGMLDFTKATN